MSDCPECAKLRYAVRDAQREVEHVVRLKSWRMVLASMLDEIRIRLLQGRVGNY